MSGKYYDIFFRDKVQKSMTADYDLHIQKTGSKHKRQQSKTASVLHQCFYICEMIIYLFSLTQDHVKTTGCFSF